MITFPILWQNPLILAPGHGEAGGGPPKARGEASPGGCPPPRGPAIRAFVPSGVHRLQSSLVSDP